MSNDEVTALLLKGAISALPQSDRDKINDMVSKIRELMASDSNEGIGMMAIALISSEIAAKG